MTFGSIAEERAQGERESVVRSLIETSADRIPMLARLALGIVIFPHGAQKVLGWFGGPGIDGALGSYVDLGLPAAVAWTAMVTELVGGVALLLGILSRVAAFAIALDLIVAAVTLHWSVGFFMNWTGQLQGEGFEFHILAVTLAVVVIVRGGGALSIDRVLTTRRTGD